MGEIDAIRNPSSGTPWFVVGGILELMGVAFLALFVVELVTGPTDDSAQVEGALQGLTVIAAAVFIAAGLLIITIGLLKHRRSR